MAETLFYPNGSSKGFPVSSRTEIIEILKTKAENIVEIDIEENLLVVARMQGDAGWLGVGRVNRMI